MHSFMDIYMDKLREVLLQEDTVLFIGSGISLWSGLPSWGGMIEKLAHFIEQNGYNADLVRDEAQRGDLLQAASYGFDKLTKQQIGEFIRLVCNFGQSQPHEIHKKIVSLGPKCFITTNYDSLIEDSLRKWKPDNFFRPPVTNRHLTETAEIVHARSSNFIFKPHGDAADIDSIVLTREQYRKLLPGGEQHSALESLKMLLASRPVIYLGFGLRDPDFMYVRDLLANTFKGGTRDHYAVMADICDSECEYWKRNYGIHLINYDTKMGSDGKKDHSNLLALLDKYKESSQLPISEAIFEPSKPEVKLALLRYVGGIARYAKLEIEFPIRVHLNDQENKKNTFYFEDEFHSSLVCDFLDEIKDNVVVLGLPGAGKTYSLRSSAARLAGKINDAFLSEDFNFDNLIIPIVVDLKLYRGDIISLVSNVLPKTLPLNEIIKSFNVRIYLDSFNEMPKEYWESGEYESDFLSFISTVGMGNVVIGSRTRDGLKFLDFKTYYLDQIDEKTVDFNLKKLDVEIDGRFNNEMRQLLQRPFYFQYVINKTIQLPSNPRPKDFYQSLFDKLKYDFHNKFGLNIDIEESLSYVAYNSLNIGEEAFLLSDLLRILKISLNDIDNIDISAHEIANWLVSSNILIPYTGGRVAFVHQSITEYLAASELARKYILTPRIIKDKIKFVRWDQALFMTLSLLPSESADMFYNDVVDTDFSLALNAVKYIEFERDQVVTKLLEDVYNKACLVSGLDYKDIYHVKNIPISNVHESIIRKLINLKGAIGGIAVTQLVELRGEEVKSELIQLLYENGSDFNFCINGVAKAIKPFITENDIDLFSTMIRDIQDSQYKKMEGFLLALSDILHGLDIRVIFRVFISENESAGISNAFAGVMTNIIRNNRSEVALEFAGYLLLKGINKAATAIYFIGRFSELDNSAWSCFSVEHINYLESNITKNNSCQDAWIQRALMQICKRRSDLANIVKINAKNKNSVEKSILLYSADKNNVEVIFDTLKELSEMTSSQRLLQPIFMFDHLDIDWQGRENIFINLLKLCDSDLIEIFFGGSCPPTCKNLGELSLGSIYWWLDWMIERSAENKSRDWFVEQLGSLLSAHLDKNERENVIAEFNKKNSKYRSVINESRILFGSDITTDDLSEDAISYLLSCLNRKDDITFLERHLLGDIATESFIDDRLIPLIKDATQPFLKNVIKIIEEASFRHGKRFIKF